jgi:hypothetical protein
MTMVIALSSSRRTTRLSLESFRGGSEPVNFAAHAGAIAKPELGEGHESWPLKPLHSWHAQSGFDKS